jgi:hypothetical protein
MRFWWAVIVLFGLSNSAYGQTPQPEAGPSIEELLLQTASKKALAAREIVYSPERVAGEVARIMTRLDGLFQDQIQERFDNHYKDVERSLQTVSLPEDVGRLEVAWQQLKAGVDPSDLEALCEDFIRRAQTQLEPQREELDAYIDSQVKEILTAELKQAQETIRAPFQEILVRYFPIWDVQHLSAPPLPTPPRLQEEDYRPNVVSPAVGLTGLLLVTLRRRIVRMVGRKMAGKALGKLIPLVGVLLLGYEVWDVAQAKTALETELRTQFLSTYAEEFSPTKIWNQPVEDGEPSARQRLEQEIRTFLHTWSEHCRNEVERMLNAARIFALSPNVQAYIAEQTQKGRHTQEIVEDMHLVGDVFGEGLIAQAPFMDLLSMIIYAPDKQELARLAHELDAWLLREYRQHGREVLVAAHALGVPTFLEVVRAGEKLDWYDVRTIFEQYPRDLSQPARRGLVLALLEQTAPAGVAPTTFENIARHEDLFRAVTPLVKPDTDKLFSLFGSSSVVDIADRAYQKDAEAAQAFVRQWPVRTWGRYRDTERFEALFAVAAYRLTERKQSAHDFAQDIGERDELTPIYADAGRCGVQLWDTYVGTPAGQHQRRVAENAIYLYKVGYPCDILQTQEGLTLAQLCQRLPFGLQAFHLMRPFGKAAYAAGFAFLLLVVAIPTRLLWRIVRKANRPATPKAGD